MYPHTNKNAILNSLMDFYDTHNGKGFSSVQSAETLGKLFGEDVGNPLIRGLYGTRNRNEVLRELSDSGIVKMASSQYSRMNDEEIAWSIRNPVKALKIKKIGDKLPKNLLISMVQIQRFKPMVRDLNIDIREGRMVSITNLVPMLQNI